MNLKEFDLSELPAAQRELANRGLAGPVRQSEAESVGLDSRRTAGISAITEVASRLTSARLAAGASFGVSVDGHTVNSGFHMD